MFLLWLVLGVLALANQRPMVAEDALRVVVDQNTVSVYRQDRTILCYRYLGAPFKPYIQQLYSPGGVNVLRDAPPGHLHHHGLMFAVAVDGVDFWAEAGSVGRQEHRGLADVRAGRTGESSHASFTQQLDWVNPAGRQLLLTERRSICVWYAKEFGATLLTWRSELQVPRGRKSVVLKGNHYFGLGMRFVSSMDGAGSFSNADGKAGEVFRGDERLVRSRWCSYTASADGKEVTVAMFDHPENLRHPATWFTMAKPFAYLSATLELHREPLMVGPERPLALRYGIAIWDGPVDTDRIEQLYKRWVVLVSADTNTIAGKGGGICVPVVED
jgi:hypothetical protein